MATFKTCVKHDKMRSDGFYQVYIRLTHRQKVAYIATEKYVNESGLDSRREVRDPFVMDYCTKQIVYWMDRLNRVQCDSWTVKEIVEYLKMDQEDISFSYFARKYVTKMFNNGMGRTSRDYRLAYENLERFAGTNNLSFARLTSAFLQNWIQSLDYTHRAKEKYPICIRQIFKSAIKELNDEERGIIRIKFNPWHKVDIPRSDKSQKLAIAPEDCRDFFNAPLPESRFVKPLPEFGRDIAMMVFCLAGINTIDLFNMKKENFFDGIIHYKRAKTMKSRADEAYFEMRVHPLIRPLFEKYGAFSKEGENGYDIVSGKEWLFNFHKRMTTSDSFCANVNIGIKKICESMGMPKENWYSVYTFRHTWGTIAQNDCGASISEVAFGMNHSAGYRITRGYLKLDFTPAWVLNDKVVELVFFTQIKGRRSQHHEDENVFEKFSPCNLMRGEAFFRGCLLGTIEDTGFSNVDSIIAKLATFVPDNVPTRCNVMFRITNLDKKQTAIYERMKGKGI